MFLLTACGMSLAEKKEAKELESVAKKELKFFLKEEFDNFKIKETEQLVSENEMEGFDISDITQFVVEIDDEDYVFAYDAETKKIWSNYHYAKIIQDVESKLNESDVLEQAERCEIQISMSFSPDVELVLHEDDTWEDVLNRINSDRDVYLIEAFYYYTDQKDFQTFCYQLDKIYEDISCLKINMYNTNEEYKENGGLHNVMDSIECQDKYTTDEEGQEEIYITYMHNKRVKIDNLLFVYNDHFYDIDITSIEYDENDPPITYYYYQQVDFVCTGQAYEIKGKFISDKERYNSSYTETYVNANEVVVYITEDKINQFAIYYPCEDFENQYLYQSTSQHMGAMQKNDDIGRRLSSFADGESVKEIIAFYYMKE